MAATEVRAAMAATDTLSAAGVKRAVTVAMADAAEQAEQAARASSVKALLV